MATVITFSKWLSLKPCIQNACYSNVRKWSPQILFSLDIAIYISITITSELKGFLLMFLTNVGLFLFFLVLWKKQWDNNAVIVFHIEGKIVDQWGKHTKTNIYAYSLIYLARPEYSLKQYQAFHLLIHTLYVLALMACFFS